MLSTPSSLFWFAARTRYKQERRICECLAELGIEYYAPFQTEKRQWSDRVKIVEVPLIPSLVFLRAEFEKATSLLSDPRLSIHYMRDLANAQRLIVPDRQMEQFMRLAHLQTDGLTLLDHNLKPGDRVRVIAGEFKGIEGELIRIKRHKRVVVRMERLFALATTYIPGEFLERIE
ncbi:MAG: UpxY family transcription antiterminator [Bacteroidales bacterium]